MPTQQELQNKARLANDPTAYLAAGGALTNGMIPTQIAQTGQETVTLPKTTATNLDSSLFKTTETTPFQTPAPTITPPITVPQLTLTEPEKEASKASKSLQDLENILAGKSAYEQEQIKAYDISGKRAVTQSLYNQIATLKAQTEAIPMELERSAGGVVTREILGRQQRELTAQNAEKALILNAQYNAAQGDLALARQNVEDAVNAKFSVYESQKNALLANLKYIKESPEYTIAEKNRAAQKEAEIKQQDAEKQKVSDIYKSVAQMAADAATDPDVDSLTLKKIQDLTSSIKPEMSIKEANNILAKAQQIAAPYLKKEKEAADVIGSAETGYIQWNPKTGKYDIAVLPPGGSSKSGSPTGDILSILSDKKIGQSTKTVIGTIMGVINAAEEMAKASPSGKFTGISPLNTILDVKIPFTDIGIPFREATKSVEGTKNTAYINAINLKVQQWASGASLTKQQTEQVAKLVPTTTDTDAKVKEKLNTLVDIMNQQIKGSLQSEGIEYSPPKTDLFASQKSLADIFNQ